MNQIRGVWSLIFVLKCEDLLLLEKKTRDDGLQRWSQKKRKKLNSLKATLRVELEIRHDNTLHEKVLRSVQLTNKCARAQWPTPKIVSGANTCHHGNAFSGAEKRN